jgi:RimJ/RimL family protein N-acetyltransferase
MTVSDYWPLPGLRLRTGDLELRLPDADDLVQLAALAEVGVHDEDTAPFLSPWHDAEPFERAGGTMRFHWSRWASWQPSDWELNLVIVRDGTVVATQGMAGKDFATLREVSTGSWVGRAYQRQGIGTAMRAAALALAFEGLGAEYAVSAAFSDNAASLGVSKKLGYQQDGFDWAVIRGKRVKSIRLRLDRENWLAHSKIDVEIAGLEPCLPFFGLPLS